MGVVSAIEFGAKNKPSEIAKSFWMTKEDENAYILQFCFNHWLNKQVRYNLTLPVVHTTAVHDLLRIRETGYG